MAKKVYSKQRYQKQPLKQPVKRNNRAKQLRKLAFDMGCVERGLANPNSQITASYERGKTKAKPEKKTLF